MARENATAPIRKSFPEPDPKLASYAGRSNGSAARIYRVVRRVIGPLRECPEP